MIISNHSLREKQPKYVIKDIKSTLTGLCQNSDFSNQLSTLKAESDQILQLIEKEAVKRNSLLSQNISLKDLSDDQPKELNVRLKDRRAIQNMNFQDKVSLISRTLRVEL